ncbi:MAG: hypothetical protein ACR2RB_09315, partial [Gammaproteobacteria bacterium]
LGFANAQPNLQVSSLTFATPSNAAPTIASIFCHTHQNRFDKSMRPLRTRAVNFWNRRYGLSVDDYHSSAILIHRAASASRVGLTYATTTRLEITKITAVHVLYAATIFLVMAAIPRLSTLDKAERLSALS